MKEKAFSINIGALYSSLTTATTSSQSEKGETRCSYELELIESNQPIKYFCVAFLAGKGSNLHYEQCRFTNSCPYNKYTPVPPKTEIK